MGHLGKCWQTREAAGRWKRPKGELGGRGNGSIRTASTWVSAPRSGSGSAGELRGRGGAMPDPKLAIPISCGAWASGRASQPASPARTATKIVLWMLGSSREPRMPRKNFCRTMPARFQIEGNVHDSRELAWHPEEALSSPRWLVRGRSCL